MTREIRDGYLYLTGEWRDGDTVTFDFPMPVRMLAANPLVREDAGKVAFVRGPITSALKKRIMVRTCTCCTRMWRHCWPTRAWPRSRSSTSTPVLLHR